MIEYFKIPSQAEINIPIKKKAFTDKISLSATEKRLVQDDIESIVMRGLFQTQTIGLQNYKNNHHNYNQIIISEVNIKSIENIKTICYLVQKIFPAHMFLIVQSDNKYCINWCDKRVAYSNTDKMIVDNLTFTRWFKPDPNDRIITDWLKSLDVTCPMCHNLKDLFDSIVNKLSLLSVADEIGYFVNIDKRSIDDYKLILKQLEINRENQTLLLNKIQEETLFDRKMEWAFKLKSLQQKESELKKEL